MKKEFIYYFMDESGDMYEAVYQRLTNLKVVKANIKQEFKPCGRLTFLGRDYQIFDKPNRTTDNLVQTQCG